MMLVYVAGPYAGTREGIAVNVARALALGRWAVAGGHAPIVTHLFGAAGLYGAPDEQDDGTSRRDALASGCALAAAVGGARGIFWGIARDDGSMSEGTAAELAAFRRAGTGAFVSVQTWAEWLARGVSP